MVTKPERTEPKKELKKKKGEKTGAIKVLITKITAKNKSDLSL